jgi:hypothetical protein
MVSGTDPPGRVVPDSLNGRRCCPKWRSGKWKGTVFQAEPHRSNATRANSCAGVDGVAGVGSARSPPRGNLKPFPRYEGSCPRWPRRPRGRHPECFAPLCGTWVRRPAAVVRVSPAPVCRSGLATQGAVLFSGVRTSKALLPRPGSAQGNPQPSSELPGHSLTESAARDDGVVITGATPTTTAGPKPVSPGRTADHSGRTTLPATINWRRSA